MGLLLYCWNSKKTNKCQHIISPKNGKSFCQQENAGLVFDCRQPYPHEKRRVCRVCTSLLAKYNRRDEKRQAKGWPRDPFLASRAWLDVRYQALKLHGAVCQCCGASRADGARIHVDHIKPRSLHPELALSVDNLQVLCGNCNLGKGNRDETDWRIPWAAIRKPD